VSFSGLLNALDGVASQQGRVTFMTTNHIENLDPALIRPGRCDVVVEIPHATPSQIRRMFRRFFPKAEVSDELEAMTDSAASFDSPKFIQGAAADAEAANGDAASTAQSRNNCSCPPAMRKAESSSFVSLLPKGNISLAKLQGFFLERRGRPDLALRDIQMLATQQAQEEAGYLGL